MQNFTEEMVSMLEQHVEKLKVIENTLYQLAMEGTDIKHVEMWMQAQSQLRITALEFQKQKYPVKK